MAPFGDGPAHRKPSCRGGRLVTALPFIDAPFKSFANGCSHRLRRFHTVACSFSFLGATDTAVCGRPPHRLIHFSSVGSSGIPVP
jgi:hypothetical protein